MSGIVIAPVARGKIGLLDFALRQLAVDLGDPYTTTPSTLAEAVCGPSARCLALLATRESTALGAAVATPVFSTRLGGAGLFVSDLWVAEHVRGAGLARRMLSATLREGGRQDAGRFLKLTVYDDNTGARAAYDKLGFTASAGETNMFLAGAALETLKETT